MIINQINNTLRVGSMHLDKIVPPSETHRSEFWDNREYVDKLFTDIIKLFDYVDEFQFDNHHEVYKFHQNTDLFEFINNIFKKNNVYNKLIFLDNNLSYKSDVVNLKSAPFFLGLSYPNNKEIIPRKFEKKFLFLNRIHKRHRFELYKLLNWTNLLDECIYSFDSNDTNSPYHRQISAKPNTFCKNVWNHHTYDIIPEYLNTFCNIVTETTFGYDSMDYLHEGTNNCIFITEKTEKCFAAGQPFIIASTPGFLKKLKELGFKTFDKWWDESYDDEINPMKRLDKIGETIKSLNKYSINDMERIYEEMIPILKHNQNLNNKWCDINSKDVRYFYKFKEINKTSWIQWNVEYNEDGLLEKHEINPKLDV